MRVIAPPGGKSSFIFGGGPSNSSGVRSLPSNTDTRVPSNSAASAVTASLRPAGTVTAIKCAASNNTTIASSSMSFNPASAASVNKCQSDRTRSSILPASTSIVDSSPCRPRQPRPVPVAQRSSVQMGPGHIAPTARTDMKRIEHIQHKRFSPLSVRNSQSTIFSSSSVKENSAPRTGRAMVVQSNAPLRHEQPIRAVPRTGRAMVNGPKSSLILG